MDNNSEVVSLYLDDIIPNRFQPREVFDEQALKELAVSIREHGVIQPIIVRKVEDKYEIIAGERRYKASTMAGLTKIPAIVKNLDDKECSKIALIENLQRKDLTPIEEARTYQKILELEDGKMTQEALAATMGKTQSSVSNKLRLLALPDEIQEALLKEKISERHARSLLNVEDKNLQIKLLDKIIADRMTVRELDKEIRELKEGKDPSESKEMKFGKLSEETGEESKEENKKVGSDNMSFNFDLNLDGTNNKPSEDAGKGLLGSSNDGKDQKAASFGNGSWTLQDNSADLKEEENSSGKVSLGLFGRNRAKKETETSPVTTPTTSAFSFSPLNDNSATTSPSTTVPISTFSLTENKEEPKADVSNLFSSNSDQKTSEFSFVTNAGQAATTEVATTAPQNISTPKEEIKVETLDDVPATTAPTEPVVVGRRSSNVSAELEKRGVKPNVLVNSFDEFFNPDSVETKPSADANANVASSINTSSITVSNKKDVTKAVSNIKSAVQALEADGYKVLLEEQDGATDYKITITLGKDA